MLTLIKSRFSVQQRPAQQRPSQPRWSFRRHQMEKDEEVIEKPPINVDVGAKAVLQDLLLIFAKDYKKQKAGPWNEQSRVLF
jgi:hypothetical protein